MSGSEIKSLIRDKGVRLWEVAAVLGVNDGNFSRRLRKPFSEEETARIINITHEIAASRTQPETATNSGT